MKENKNEISRQEFDDLKRDVKDLQKVFDKINSIAISTEKLAVEMKYMREEQTKMDGRITTIEEKPVKRYDSIVTYIITTVIGAAIGYFISLIKTK
ncbi:MAG: hypothetical protein VZQ62_00290 [Methanosphaera sp.]|nr:hypothetical protein [Methanosphaera sp.]